MLNLQLAQDLSFELCKSHFMRLVKCSQSCATTFVRPWESSVIAWKIYGFVKKQIIFVAPLPKEKTVSIFTAASLSPFLFLRSFLSQHLDCSISHWIILGRTSKWRRRDQTTFGWSHSTPTLEEWRKKESKKGNLSYFPKGALWGLEYKKRSSTKTDSLLANMSSR